MIEEGRELEWKDIDGFTLGVCIFAVIGITTVIYILIAAIRKIIS